MEGETDYIAFNSKDVRAARVALLAVPCLLAPSSVQAAAGSGARVHKAKDEVLKSFEFTCLIPEFGAAILDVIAAHITGEISWLKDTLSAFATGFA